jgi:hypothetical protein
MIRHFDVRGIPSTDSYRSHVALLAGTQSTEEAISTTVSLRPRAAWQLMRHHIDHEGRNAHPFLEYLGTIGTRHLCVQLPILDQHVEDSLMPHRRMPRQWYDIFKERNELRNAMIGLRGPHRDTRFFGFFRACPNLTIHNLTLVSIDHALPSPRYDSEGTVRVFFRPCTGADVDVTDKIYDNYCYNHLDKNHLGIVDGTVKLSPRVLESSQSIQFIDMDWVRGKYDHLRDGALSRSIDDQVQHEMQRAPVIGNGNRAWGQKHVKISSEVEACESCGRHQLSAVEVRQSQREGRS